MRPSQSTPAVSAEPDYSKWQDCGILQSWTLAAIQSSGQDMRLQWGLPEQGSAAPAGCAASPGHCHPALVGAPDLSSWLVNEMKLDMARRLLRAAQYYVPALALLLLACSIPVTHLVSEHWRGLSRCM